MAGFAGFYCRNCGSRVFEDEPYIDGSGKKMAVLTCLLCSKIHQCKYKDYKYLKDYIENVIKQKRGKAFKRKILSSAR